MCPLAIERSRAGRSRVRRLLGRAKWLDAPGAWTWELPRWGRGWAVDGVLTMRTATPVDVTFYRDLGFGIYNLRPDPVEGVPLMIADENVAGGTPYHSSSFFE